MLMAKIQIAFCKLNFIVRLRSAVDFVSQRWAAQKTVSRPALFVGLNKTVESLFARTERLTPLPTAAGWFDASASPSGGLFTID
jgi:hypothetical protein